MFHLQSWTSDMWWILLRHLQRVTYKHIKMCLSSSKGTVSGKGFFFYSILQMYQGYDKMQVGYIFLSSLLSDTLIGLLSSKKPFSLLLFNQA